MSNHTDQIKRLGDERDLGSMLIGDEWISSGSNGAFEDRDPATGDLIATLPDSGEAEVERAVERAREALGVWAGLGGDGRARLLQRLADRVEEAQERIAAIESLDNGRPHRETASQARIVARWYRYYAGMADKIEGATIPVAGPYLNYTQRVPVGVCAAITPWNHPLLIATKKVAPALACGNTLVVKPSELAPLSVIELGRLALEAGIPPGVLNVVSGQRPAGEALVASAGVDRVDLTGSTATGIAIAQAAAATMKRVGLELGGKAANIVFADADLERSVRGAAFAGFIGQGQTCVAGSRVLVERSVAAEFAERLTALVGGIRVGDPLEPATQMGPLITPRAAERVAGMVAGALEQGARLVAGGEVPDGLGPHLSAAGYFRPTLVWTDDPSIEIAQEEIFGPVVTLIPFEGEQEALAIANSVPYGLGAAVWTHEVARAHRMAQGLRAGVVWINDYHRVDPGSPWGGFGLSGYGRENGYEAVRMFTEVKSVWVATEEQSMEWYDSSGSDVRLN